MYKDIYTVHKDTVPIVVTQYRHFMITSLKSALSMYRSVGSKVTV